jgi:hypothetical protein
MPRYTVTNLAGPKVAGRRVEPGETIDLSENAARAELLAGVIAPVVDEPAQAPAEDAPATEKKTLKRG